MRHPRSTAVLLSLLLAGVLGLTPASAPAQESIEDARTERDDVRQEAAEIAATIDLLDAEDADVAAALADLASFIAKAEADIETALTAIDQAEAEATAADTEAARLDGEIETARAVVTEFAISAYVTNNGNSLELLLSSDDPRTGELRRFFVELASGSSGDAVAALRDLIDDQFVARRSADEARARADQARVDLELDRAALGDAVVAAEAVRADIRTRIDAWQGETLALEAADAELTQFIRAEQIRIEAARVEEERLQALFEQQRQAEIERQRQAELEVERQAEAERQAELERESQEEQDREAETTEDDSSGNNPTDEDPASEDDSAPDDVEAPPPLPPPSAPTSFIWPINGGVSSTFGFRIHPIFGNSRFHSGIDINGGSGLPIASSAAGVVLSAGWRDGYGNTVVIDHGGGFATLYAHQSQVAVSAGQAVNQGEIIGFVGSTGWSTGPHLHFEIRIDGTPVDPLAYL